MRDWVKPYLIQRITDEIRNDPNSSQKEKREMVKLRCEEIELEELEVYSKLTGQLQCDFGRGIGRGKDQFEDAFGSVLSNLPEEIFQKLSQMRNLFFIFTPHEGATCRKVPLKYDLKFGDGVIIVNFPYSTVSKSAEAIRGTIAHELAHIAVEHDLWTEENEKDADETAKRWGFSREIEALNGYWRDMEQKA